MHSPQKMNIAIMTYTEVAGDREAFIAEMLTQHHVISRAGAATFYEAVKHKVLHAEPKKRLSTVTITLELEAFEDPYETALLAVETLNAHMNNNAKLEGTRTKKEQ